MKTKPEELRIADWLAFHADRTPDKVCLIDQHSARSLTYAELHQQSEALAAYFHAEWRVKAGDRIAILAKNSLDYFVVQYACFKVGAIFLPLNWRLTPSELAYMWIDAQPVGIAYETAFLPLLQSVLQREDLASVSCVNRLKIDGLKRDAQNALSLDSLHEPLHEPLHSTENSAVQSDVTSEQATVSLASAIEAYLNLYINVYTKTRSAHGGAMLGQMPAIMMYTSGTTGRPKGVIITRAMLFWNALNLGHVTGMHQQSRQYSVLPCFHIAGLNIYVNPLLYFGASALLAREFDASLTLSTLADPQESISHFFGVPSIYLFLSQHPDFCASNLSHVQSWGCGGAPMPAELLSLYRQKGITIQLGYGMTETGPGAFLSDQQRAQQKPTSIGKPLMHTRARIVDAQGHDMQAGVVGEVWISGPNVTPGYWQRPDANTSEFQWDADGVRWLRTGDAGYQDEEGCFFIVDRFKDMYISGGENVYPAEVEQVLYGYPGIQEAAVIGVEDTTWGESGVAYLVWQGDSPFEYSRFEQYCRAHLAKFKIPTAVRFLESLPRNAAGKILKTHLKQHWQKEK